MTTLVGLLDHKARTQPEIAPLEFLGDTANPPNYADLDRLARATAARLTELTAPGDRVLLVMPSGTDFVATFFGCLYARVLPVPCPPPLPGPMAERFAAIVADCAPNLLVTERDWVAMLAAVEGPKLVSAHELRESATDPADFVLPEVRPSNTAYLQYTGGTTGSPRGIVLTHANVLANLALASADNVLTGEDLMIGWLPLFHDLGLVSQVLQPLYDGYRVVMMQPQDFVADPAHWLRTVSERAATMAALPGFAYDMLLRRIPAAERATLRLDRLRIARTGAEVLDPAQITEFLAGFAASGLRPESLSTAYGLGEAVVHVCIAPLNTPPVMVRADRQRLERGEVVSGAEDAETVLLAGSGRPGSGVWVTIASLDEQRSLPEGFVGEIMITGSSVAAGYWGVEGGTIAVGGVDGFLPTGDLGCLLDGELFVLGRTADLIVAEGRWIFPVDVERTAASATPSVRAHACAVFAVDGAVVLVAETKHADEAAIEAIRAGVLARHGLELKDIRLVGRGSLPMTTSGKLRRGRTRDLYQQGALN
ncbi:AMP-binding protein [Nocardia macrotermitis]|nr:AMP-binding protein [Nocardia macrotermitis]